MILLVVHRAQPPARIEYSASLQSESVYKRLNAPAHLDQFQGQPPPSSPQIRIQNPDPHNKLKRRVRAKHGAWKHAFASTDGAGIDTYHGSMASGAANEAICTVCKLRIRQR